MGLLDLFRKKAPGNSFMLSREFQALEMKWGNSTGEVESAWSLLYNLKEYTGPRADKFEALCRQNIDLFLAVRSEYIRNRQTVAPSICEGYKRLAMLYEKRKDYLRAYEICREAIDNGAEAEYGNKKGMITRAVRYGKKAGIEIG